MPNFFAKLILCHYGQINICVCICIQCRVTSRLKAFTASEMKSVTHLSGDFLHQTFYSVEELCKPQLFLVLKHVMPHLYRNQINSSPDSPLLWRAEALLANWKQWFLKFFPEHYGIEIPCSGVPWSIPLSSLAQFASVRLQSSFHVLNPAGELFLLRIIYLFLQGVHLRSSRLQ